MYNLNLENVRGYVLSVNKFKEKDGICTLLTTNKLVTYKVNSGLDVLNKNHQACLPYNLVELDLKNINDSSNLTCIGVKTIQDNSIVYKDLDNNLAIQVMVEALLKSIQEDDNVPFDYFSNCLQAIKEGFDYLTVIYIFLCKLSMLIGIPIVYDGCVNCASKKNLVTFSFLEGGFICQKCSTYLHLYPKTVEYMKIIRYGYMVNQAQIKRAILPKESLVYALQDLSLYYEESLGVKLNSLKLFLDNLK